MQQSVGFQFVVASLGYCMSFSPPLPLYNHHHLFVEKPNTNPIREAATFCCMQRHAINVSCIFPANFLIKMLFMHFSVAGRIKHVKN